MEIKVVTFDIDDVLFDFIGGFANFYNNLHGTSYWREDFHTTHLEEDFGCSKCYVDKLMKNFILEGHLERLELIEGAVEAITSLTSFYKIAAVTSRSDLCKDSTYASLDKHFPGKFFDVRFSQNKHFETQNRQTKGDIVRDMKALYHVDDTHDYCIQCSPHCTSLLFNAPWNINAPLTDNMRRVFSHKHIREILLQR